MFSKEALAAGSMVHCTVDAWDDFIQEDANTCKDLRKKQNDKDFSEEDRALLEDAQTRFEDRLGWLLESLMLRRSMSSKVPFNNPQPIINIPTNKITTKMLQFGSRRQLAIYSGIVNTGYEAIKNRAKTDTEASTMSFSPQWRFLRHVSLAPVLASVAANPQDGNAVWVRSRPTVGSYDADRQLVEEVVDDFLADYPEYFKDIIPAGQTLVTMSNEQLAQGLSLGAPKMTYLANLLDNIVTKRKQKVIVWTYWPATQWFTEQVSPTS
jgi:hypothetical protein